MGPGCALKGPWTSGTWDLPSGISKPWIWSQKAMGICCSVAVFRTVFSGIFVSGPAIKGSCKCTCDSPSFKLSNWHLESVGA